MSEEHLNPLGKRALGLGEPAGEERAVRPVARLEVGRDEVVLAAEGRCCTTSWPVLV
jgi:hypothetical protein